VANLRLHGIAAALAREDAQPDLAIMVLDGLSLTLVHLEAVGADPCNLEPLKKAARTSEGRERAKARGVKMGRKPKLTDHLRSEAIRRRDKLGEPVREIARSYNVSHSTISRLTA
jgi:hypothetical protein